MTTPRFDGVTLPGRFNKPPEASDSHIRLEDPNEWSAFSVRRLTARRCDYCHGKVRLSQWQFTREGTNQLSFPPKRICWEHMTTPQRRCIQELYSR